MPEDRVIPPRHGPLALPEEELLLEVEDVEVIVEVEGFGPEHQRAATAAVASALLSVFLTAEKFIVVSTLCFCLSCCLLLV